MRVLVTAASKHGAADEMADWIANVISAAGIDVARRDVPAIVDLAGFDAVVLGSAVYAGKWMESALDFVDRLAPSLREVPVWLFSSGPAGNPPKPTTGSVDVANVMKAIGARGHEVFAGRIDRTKLGAGEMAVLSVLRLPDGDFRQRAEVEAWAAEVVAALSSHERQVSPHRPSKLSRSRRCDPG